MKALLLVDLQNDFMPGGVLAVAGGDEVVRLANRLMLDFELVIATKDWHPPNHCSFASQHPGRKVGEQIMLDGREQVLWPDHCVQGTPGAAFSPELNTPRIRQVVEKGVDCGVDSYSAFCDNAHGRDTGLAAVLRSRNVDELHIAGLTTDYCVKFSALDALAQGFRVVVRREGIRGVELSPGDCHQALEMMRSAGAQLC